MAAYVLAERQSLLRQLVAMEDQQTLEEALKRAGLSVSSLLLSLRQEALGEGQGVDGRHVAPYALEAAGRALDPWIGRLPALGAELAVARQRLAGLGGQPSRADVLDLRSAVESFGRAVEMEEVRARERREGLARAFREDADRIALTSLALGIFGLLVFGVGSTVFFTRLAWDLRQLGQRANDIVSGFRGEPLEIVRRDEVGSLARDVNHMAAALASRERELALSQEIRAHREKMAALGAMARNLAHEIGNPLATISGIAQGAIEGGDEATAKAHRADEILRQTRRIAEITRQIADFAGPSTAAAEAVDLRAMVGAVCDFMQYDPRFRATRIERRLPKDLPIVVVIPDQLSEVLMSVLQSSVEEGAGAAPARLTVEGERREAHVVVRVLGGSLQDETPRWERTRQLVETMGGRLAGDDSGTIELTLPGALAVAV